MRRFPALASSIVFLSLTLSLCLSASAQETLQIGILAPITGPLAALGQSGYNGALMAIDAWNDRGGVLGREIEGILMDTQCDPSIAVYSAKRAILVDGANFIVGGFCETTAFALAQVANEAKVLMISPTCTSRDLTLKEDYVFRMSLSDDDRAEGAAKFAIEELDAHKAAIIYNSETIQGKRLALCFTKAFCDLGGDVIGEIGYSPYSDDLYTFLSDTTIWDANIVFCPSSLYEAGHVNSVLDELDSGATLLGIDNWQMSATDYGSLTGSYFAAQYSPYDPRPVVPEFLAAFEDGYNLDADAWAVLAYDATTALLMAIDAAKTDDPSAVRDALSALKFEGVSGSTSFDKYGNPTKDYSLPLPLYQVGEKEEEWFELEFLGYSKKDARKRVAKNAVDEVLKEESAKTATSWIGTVLGSAGVKGADQGFGIAVEIYNAVRVVKGFDAKFLSLLKALHQIANGQDPTMTTAANDWLDLFGAHAAWRSLNVIQMDKELRKWRDSFINNKAKAKEIREALATLEAQFRKAKTAKAAKSSGTASNPGKYSVKWERWFVDIQWPWSNRWEWKYTVTNTSGRDITYFEIQLPRSIPVKDTIMREGGEWEYTGGTLHTPGGNMTLPNGWAWAIDTSRNVIKFMTSGTPYVPIRAGASLSFHFLVDDEVGNGAITVTVGRYASSTLGHVKDPSLAVGGPGY